MLTFPTLNSSYSSRHPSQRRISFNNLKTPPPGLQGDLIITSSSLTSLRGTTVSVKSFRVSSYFRARLRSHFRSFKYLIISWRVISAMSHMNQSRAFLPAKAFLVGRLVVPHSPGLDWPHLSSSWNDKLGYTGYPV